MVVGMRQRTYEASEAAKREICAALKTLMAQKPLNKITIVEIMQSCGMARQHFTTTLRISTTQCAGCSTRRLWHCCGSMRV